MLRRFFTTAPERPAQTERVVTVSHEGCAIAVLVRRKPAARRMTLRVETATRRVVVTAPARTSLASAQNFAERHAGWIAVRVARLPALVPLEAGGLVPLRGVEHRIVAAPAGRARVTAGMDEDGAPVLLVGGEPAHHARRVRDWLQAEARRDLAAAVARHAAAAGRAPTRLTVRDTRSRWGSCSATGRLSFSWRLILAPAHVLDYLAAHEVAHLVEMNHSPRFWRVVRGLFPEMEAAEAWLQRHGSALHRYG